MCRQRRQTTDGGGILPEAGQVKALRPHTSKDWLCSGSYVGGVGLDSGGDPGLHQVSLTPSFRSLYCVRLLGLALTLV